jgi:EpsI family protein
VITKHSWTVIALLMITAGLLFTRGDADVVPPSDPLAQLPRVIGTWAGRDLPIDPDTRNVLGNGDFLSRVYLREKPSEAVALFIGYFPQQRIGTTVHSPKHCLPGAGWDFESSQYISLRDVRGKVSRVGEYTIVNGDQRQFIIYWYQAHGRSVPNEYMARLALAVDAVRLRRTDGALVRVMTPIDSVEDIAAARSRTETFAANLMPMLNRFIPD